MAGVGDYIHYWQSSYDKYGINKDQKSSQSASNILNQQKTKILSQVSKGTKKNYLNLQNALNRMIYPNGAYDPKAYDQYRDELEYLIGETALRWVAVWNEAGASRRISEKGVRIKKSTITRLGDTAQKILNGLEHSNNVHDLENRKNQLQNLINQINQLSESVQNLPRTKKGFINLGNSKTAKNLINEINSSLDAIATSSRTSAIGEHFEGAIALLDDRFTDKIENYSYDFVKQILTGNNPYTIEGEAPIATDLHDTIDLEGEKGSISLTGNFKENNMKMDISLQYENESFRISAKNYKLSNKFDIHLGKAQPFLNMLQKNTSDTFINHYLNIVTSNRGNNRIPHAQAQNAHYIAKLIIAAEAIAGISQQQGYADTLIINNRSKRQIIVKPIKEFFNPIFQEELFKISGYNLETSWYNYNKWFGPYTEKDYELAKTRIAKLLAQLHKIKITTSLNTANLWT